MTLRFAFSPARAANPLKATRVMNPTISSSLKSGPAKTVQGSAFNVKAADGKVMVDNANVTKTDIVADNGVIHVIDSVILPK